VTYQLGNLLAAINLPLQTRLADHYDQNFGLGMAIVIVPGAGPHGPGHLVGPENRGAQLGEISAPEGRRPAAARSPTPPPRAAPEHRGRLRQLRDRF
jgi:MFS transporter, SHS family, lactate transporter